MIVARLWVLAAVLGYVGLAIRNVVAPLNPGHDGIWLAVTCVTAVAGVMTYRWCSRARADRWWLGLHGSIALAMVVMSGQIVAALATAWLFLLAWLLGRAMLHALPRSALDGVVIGTGIGLVGLSLVGLTMAAAGLFTPSWIRRVLIALTIGLLAWSIRQRPGGVLSHSAPPAHPRTAVGSSDLAALPVVGVSVLIALAWALAPEIQYDALNYHLPVPAAYLSAGRLVELPDFWHSYFAQMGEMFFGLGLGLHGPSVSKLSAFAIAMLGVAATFALAARLFSPAVAVWAAAWFATTPIVVRAAGTADVDLAATVLLAAAWLGVLNGIESNRPAWILPAGLLLGGAIGVRPTAAFGFLPLVAAMVWMAARDRSLGIRVRQLGATIGLAALAAVPWYLVRFAFTGNPFFPFFDRTHPKVGSAARNLHSAVTANELLAPLWSMPEALVFLPFRFSFDTSHFGAHPAGACGVALLIVVPTGALVLARRAPPLIGWALLSAGVFLAGWHWAFPHARLYLPVLPLVAALAVASIVAIGPAHLARGLLAAVVVAHVAVIPVQFWNVPERVPVARVFGRETERAFLSRAVPAYSAIEYLNERVKPGERVIGSGAGADARFYLRAPFSTLSESWTLRRLENPLNTAAAAVLAASGYGYLIVDHSEPPYPILPDPFRDPAFFDRFATPLFGWMNVTVYRLSDRPVVPRTFPNELTNASFEARNREGWPEGWQPYGRPVVLTDRAHAASGSVAIEVTPSGGLFQRVTVSGRKLYRLSQKIRADRSGERARLQINWIAGSGTLVGTSIRVVGADPSWQRHELHATAPLSARAAHIYLSVHERSVVRFDDLCFEHLPGAPGAGH
jgi:hypothetical protein